MAASFWVGTVEMTRRTGLAASAAETKIDHRDDLATPGRQWSVASINDFLEDRALRERKVTAGRS